MKQRNYGLDLLRLVLMYMVCVLHTLGQGGVLNASAGTAYSIFWGLEIFCYCAVDSFALMSGYTASNKPRTFEELAEMWFQVFFYSFVLTGILTVFVLREQWTTQDMLRCAMPVIYGKFWYFSAFFALYFAMPVLNKFLFSLSAEQAKKALLVVFIGFSVMETLTGVFYTNKGYSTVWLMALYAMGLLAKQSHLFENKSTGFLFILWMGCIAATWISKIKLHISLAVVSYTSPTILLSGILMVLLFARIPLKGTIIAKLSPLAFGIYLFHTNQVIWSAWLKGRFIFAASEPLYLGVLLVLCIAFAIFISGLLVETLRFYLAKWLRIPALSKKVVQLVEYIFAKASLLLG